MTRSRGFAFDLEGTLVDVERAHHEGHLVAARSVGVHVTIDEAVGRFPHFIGGPDRDLAQEIWEVSDRSATAEEVLARTRVAYEENLKMTRVALRPGAREFILRAKALRVEVSIGSLTPRRYAEVLLARSGLGEVIPPDHVVLGEDVSQHKPAPDVFLETAWRMDVDPADQVVFEDSPNGVAAAVAAGSTAVAVVTREDMVDAVRERGARRVYGAWNFSVEEVLAHVL